MVRGRWSARPKYVALVGCAKHAIHEPDAFHYTSTGLCCPVLITLAGIRDPTQTSKEAAGHNDRLRNHHDMRHVACYNGKPQEPFLACKSDLCAGHQWLSHASNRRHNLCWMPKIFTKIRVIFRHGRLPIYLHDGHRFTATFDSAAMDIHSVEWHSHVTSKAREL